MKSCNRSVALDSAGIHITAECTCSVSLSKFENAYYKAPYNPLVKQNILSHLLYLDSDKSLPIEFPSLEYSGDPIKFNYDGAGNFDNYRDTFFIVGHCQQTVSWTCVRAPIYVSHIH